MHRTSHEQKAQISSQLHDPGSGVSSLASVAMTIMSSGALHQITPGGVSNNNVDQSAPHRNIRNYNIYTPSAIPRSRRRKEASALPMCVLARPTNDVVNCIAPASAAQRVGPQRVQRVST